MSLHNGFTGKVMPVSPKQIKQKKDNPFALF